MKQCSACNRHKNVLLPSDILIPSSCPLLEANGGFFSVPDEPKEPDSLTAIMKDLIDFLDAHDKSPLRTLPHLLSRIDALGKGRIMPELSKRVETFKDEAKKLATEVVGPFVDYGTNPVWDSLWVLVNKLKEKVAEIDNA